MRRRPVARRGSRGMTLIEVLVAVLVFSFGLLGLLGLQARAVQYSIGAEDQNRAALLANELGSTMLATGTLAVDADTLAAWQARVADASVDGLPNGTGTVDVDADVATITVSWRPPSAPEGRENRYVTQVVAP